MLKSGGITDAKTYPVALTLEEIRALAEELSDLWIRTSRYGSIRTALAKLEAADAAATAD